MKIALIVNQIAEFGGGFQYELNLVRALAGKKEPGNTYIVITSRKENIALFYNTSIPVKLFRISFVVKIELFLRQVPALFKYLIKLMPFAKISTFDCFLNKNNFDLAYFLSPNHLALLCDRFNYISTVWDLCHRDFPEFPEVRENFEFENRELLLQKTLPKAIAVIVDSNLGGKNVARRYLVDYKRIVTLPFFVNEEEYKVVYDIKTKYGINGDYIFYPAQFWAHKNHTYIIDSLYELKINHNKKISAIFPGADMGNLAYVKEYARKLCIHDQIVFPGFLQRSEIVECYKQALALVYPTYFGPTNIPPLEAFYLNCIVLHGDIESFKEQTKDAALYFDLSNPHSLTEILNTLSNNPLSFEYLKTKGKRILGECSNEKAVEKIETIIAEYALKMKTWKMPSVANCCLLKRIF